MIYTWRLNKEAVLLSPSIRDYCSCHNQLGLVCPTEAGAYLLLLRCRGVVQNRLEQAYILDSHAQYLVLR